MTWSTAHLSVSGHPWDLNVQLAALSLASANLILKLLNHPFRLCILYFLCILYKGKKNDLGIWEFQIRTNN